MSTEFDQWAKAFVNDPKIKPTLDSIAMGHNDALEWAANWVVNSAQANGNPAVIEFAANMAMTFRAATMKKGQQL